MQDIAVGSGEVATYCYGCAAVDSEAFGGSGVRKPPIFGEEDRITQRSSTAGSESEVVEARIVAKGKRSGKLYGVIAAKGVQAAQIGCPPHER